MAQRKKNSRVGKIAPKMPKLKSANKSSSKATRKKEIIKLVDSLREKFDEFKLDAKNKQNIEFYLSKVEKFTNNL